MTMQRRTLTMSLGIAAMAAMAMPAMAYTFTDLPSYGTAVAINNNGQILFSSGLVLNTNGTTSQYSVPGAARGLNDNGQIVGTYTVSNVKHGYITTGLTSYSTFNASGSGVTGTSLNSINDSGEVAGFYTTSSSQIAFTSLSGKQTIVSSSQSAATGVNNSGQVSWNVYAAGSSEAEDTSETSYALGWGWGALANGISDNNVVVGTSMQGVVLYGQGNPSGPYGFVQNVATNGSPTVLTDPNDYNGITTTPYGINKSGVIVGVYQKSSGVTVAFKATP